jgi:hypothetical protein
MQGASSLLLCSVSSTYQTASPKFSLASWYNKFFVAMSFKRSTDVHQIIAVEEVTVTFILLASVLSTAAKMLWCGLIFKRKLRRDLYYYLSQ